MPQLRLAKPKAILFDVTGTASNTSFVNRFLVTYLRKSVAKFILNNWGHIQIIRDIDQLRKVAKENASWPDIPESNNKEIISQAVSNLVGFLIDNNLDCLAFAQLRFHVWFDGYDKGLLRTPVYSDVAIQMKKWRCDYEIQLYVLSHGWAEANRVFLSRTNQGDMSLLIDDYFDSSLGLLNEASTYHSVLEKIKQKPHDVLFLTKSLPAMKAAKSIGIYSVLVITYRNMIETLSPEERESMSIVHTMNEIEFY